MTRLFSLITVCATVLAVPFAEPEADPTIALGNWPLDGKKVSFSSQNTDAKSSNEPQSWLPSINIFRRTENVPVDSNNHPGHPMAGAMGMFKPKPAVIAPAPAPTAGAIQTQIITLIIPGPTVTITEQIVIATQAEFCIQATEAAHGPKDVKPPLPSPQPELLPSRPTQEEKDEARRRKEGLGKVAV